MRKLVVLTFLSLDGVMQAPGSKDEDTSGGFDLGGWTFPLFDEVGGEIMTEQMTPPFDLLLGRKTYDIFAGYWPKQDDEIAHIFNPAKKYVISHKPIALEWANSELVTGVDVAGNINELKKQDGPMLQVHGSGDLIQTLLKYDLVDELWLKTFPVTLGKGKKLFDKGTIAASFKLVSSKITPTGVIFANYKRDGEVKTGTF